MPPNRENHERQCVAKRRDGQRCTQWAIRGTTVCKMHGGKTGHIYKAAQRRVAEQEAERAVKTYGLPRDVAPHDALLEEVRRTAGHVAWLGALIEAQQPDDLKQQAIGEGGSVSYERPSVWLDLYRDERRHLARVCKDAIAAGIAERHVRVAEQHAELFARVISAALSDPELGLEPAAQMRARTVFARHLASVKEPA